MKWARALGYEYTVGFAVEFNVSVNEADDKSDAEDKAWEILEKELDKNEDFKEVELETLSINNSLFGGYMVKIRVRLTVYAVGVNHDDAFEEAYALVEDNTWPEGITVISIEADDFIIRGERVVQYHGDGV